MKPSPSPAIGVLALQGSFELHLKSLERLGVEGLRVRYAQEIDTLDGLIIPGGESTVMTGVAQEIGLFGEIRAAATAGLPIFGTCAGSILLGEGKEYPERLSLVPVTVHRNAYGRQIDSFEKQLWLRPFEEPFTGIFIRAPKIELPARFEEKGIEVLGQDGDEPVLISFQNILMATFHPELTEDTRVHQFFLDRYVQTFKQMKGT